MAVYFNSVQAEYCLYLILPINITNPALALYVNGPLHAAWKWKGLGTESSGMGGNGIVKIYSLC